jgi:hypothetical protein
LADGVQDPVAQQRRHQDRDDHRSIGRDQLGTSGVAGPAVVAALAGVQVAQDALAQQPSEAATVGGCLVQDAGQLRTVAAAVPRQHQRAEPLIGLGDDLQGEAAGLLGAHAQMSA